MDTAPAGEAETQESELQSSLFLTDFVGIKLEMRLERCLPCSSERAFLKLQRAEVASPLQHC